MDETQTPVSAGAQDVNGAQARCPTCDAVAPAGATRCIMCGASLARPPDAPEIVAATLRQRPSRALLGLTAVVTLCTILLGALTLNFQGPTVSLALVATATPIPPTPTYTPPWTPLPTQTLPPSATPTITPLPPPTDTPSPPRFHQVASGETLIGLSLVYRVSPDSIAEANGFGLEAPIQAGQNLQIPWPTATPPLESVVLTINGEPVIADVTDCKIVEIKPGDSAFALAVQNEVPLAAIIAVNRQTEASIQLLQPGNTLCIPRMVYSDTLPPTPGPSPTPTATLPPRGPNLLFPLDGTVLDPPDGVVRLQWTAVKDLASAEWYMVELVNLDLLDSLPWRDFTRDTSFQLPPDWRPVVLGRESHRFRWGVSIVQVTGRRSDGGFIYTYGGESSAPSFFTWLGATPTPTPTPTPLPTATPIAP